MLLASRPNAQPVVVPRSRASRGSSSTRSPGGKWALASSVGRVRVGSAIGRSFAVATDGGRTVAAMCLAVRAAAVRIEIKNAVCPGRVFAPFVGRAAGKAVHPQAHVADGVSGIAD